MPFARRAFILATAIVASLAAPGAATAATTYTVTREDDPEIVLACTTNDCSLRAAVNAVNAGSGGDTIQLPARNYALADTQLVLSKDVTIVGAGARTTVIAPTGSVHRLFEVAAFAALRGVTLSGGNARWGGAVLVDPGHRLDLDAATVKDSQARGQTMGDPMYGGGILNQGGTLNVTSSTFTGNQAYFSLAASGYGGAIATLMQGTPGTTNLTNVTIFNNLAHAGSGNGLGGGVYTGAGATTTITNSTLAGNRAETLTPGQTPAGGNVASDGTTQLLDTIVADGQAGQGVANCGGTIASLGHNLDSRDECGFSATLGDLTNANPGLGPLQDNGGPTDTHAIGATSPAFDAGGTGCPTTDQRGVARPQGAACDIGAFELAVSPPDEPLPDAAPEVSGLSASPSTFVLGKFLPRASRTVGTTIRFNLSEAATATLAFTRRAPGRRVGRRCVAPRRSNRSHRRCRRTIRVGKLTYSLAAGQHSVRFSGRLSRRKRLLPGRHRLVVSAVDATGRRGTPQRIGLRALRAPRR
jgi:hypothetical protein